MLNNFSHRNGLTPLPSFLKLGELPPSVRNDIEHEVKKFFSKYYNLCDPNEILNDLLVKHFDKELQPLPYPKEHVLYSFLSAAPYHEVLDILEFIINHQNVKKIDVKNVLGECIHDVFEQRRVAYFLFKDGDSYKFYPRASEEEGKAYVCAIENLTQDDAFFPAKTHLLKAGDKLRRSDYAGSIQDSIHAVESVAKIILKKKEDMDFKKNKFSDVLRHLSTEFGFHPSLKEGIIKIYGFTSDEQCLRHSATGEPITDLNEDLALFFLGICSSFVTYFIKKYNSKK